MRDLTFADTWLKLTVKFAGDPAWPSVLDAVDMEILSRNHKRHLLFAHLDFYVRKMAKTRGAKAKETAALLQRMANAVSSEIV